MGNWNFAEGIWCIGRREKVWGEERGRGWGVRGMWCEDFDSGGEGMVFLRWGGWV